MQRGRIFQWRAWLGLGSMRLMPKCFLVPIKHWDRKCAMWTWTWVLTFIPWPVYLVNRNVNNLVVIRLDWAFAPRSRLHEWIDVGRVSSLPHYTLPVNSKKTANCEVYFEWTDYRLDGQISRYVVDTWWLARPLIIWYGWWMIEYMG